MALDTAATQRQRDASGVRTPCSSPMHAACCHGASPVHLYVRERCQQDARGSLFSSWVSSPRQPETARAQPEHSPSRPEGSRRLRDAPQSGEMGSAACLIGLYGVAPCRHLPGLRSGWHWCGSGGLPSSEERMRMESLKKAVTVGLARSVYHMSPGSCGSTVKGVLSWAMMIVARVSWGLG